MISKGRLYLIETTDQEHTTASEEFVTGLEAFICAFYGKRRLIHVDEPCCSHEREM